MSDFNFMIEVEEVFKLAYNQAMASRGEVDKHKAIIFLDALINYTKPFSLVNEEGIRETTGLVFNDSVASDLVEDLKFQFFSRWGYQNVKLTNLCEHLSFGVSGDFSNEPGSEGLFSSPKEYQSRYPVFNDTVQYLKVNKWVICLLLLQLTIVLDPRDVERARNFMAKLNENANA